MPEQLTSKKYEVITLKDNAPELSDDQLNSFTDTITNSGIGSTRFKRVNELTNSDLQGMSNGEIAAIHYSGSRIVDHGGINNLVDGIAVEEQQFSTQKINDALIENGIIPSDLDAIKMGPAGAVVENGRGGEVIEATMFKTRKDVDKIMSKAKVAWSDQHGNLRVTTPQDDNRVILENQVVLTKKPIEESKAIAMEIDVTTPGVDLVKLISNAANAAGIEDYSVRCTISGPITTDLSVLTSLPQNPLQDMKEVGTYLQKFPDVNFNGTFHFTGSRTALESRQSEKWGSPQFTGNPVYSPDGHYHGYGVEQEIGGHILNMRPNKGALVKLLIEPAEVVQVVKQ